jgi:hypothetical protein
MRCCAASTRRPKCTSSAAWTSAPRPRCSAPTTWISTGRSTGCLRIASARGRGSTPDRLGPFAAPYLEAEVQHVTRQDRLQPGAYEPAPPPEAYTLTDLRIGTEVTAGGLPLRLALGVQNLFDVRYRDYLSRFRYFIDEPGRTVVLRLSIPFGHLADSSR